MRIREVITPEGSTSHPLRIPKFLPVDEEVYLQRTSPADTERLYELADENREFLMQTLEYMHIYTLDGAERQRRLQTKDMQHGKEAPYMIFYKGDLAGEIDLYCRDGNEAYLGYHLAEQATGQRVASRAARALVDFGFNRWALEEVELAIKPDNVASARVAQSLGATKQPGQIQHPNYKGDLRTYDIWSLQRD
jgi:ribosomal-protein-serine acetyltransferase